MKNNVQIKRPRVFLILMVFIIVFCEGSQKPTMAGVLDSIRILFKGKEMPVVNIRGRLFFTSDRYEKLNEDGSATKGGYILSDGKIKRIHDGVIIGRWSPDGEHLVCKAIIEENGERSVAIIIIDSRGHQKNIVIKKATSANVLFSQPTFSRDGERILFISNINTATVTSKKCADNLFSVDKNGDDLKQLTFFKSDIQSVFHFDLSPDGHRILFTSRSDRANYNSKFAIFIMDSNGNNCKKFTGKTLRGRNPRWSHNGKHIAFSARNDEDEYSQIYIIDENGCNIKKITTSKFGKDEPCWSSDSRALCYQGYRHGSPFAYSELFIINLDGTGESLIMEPAKIGKVWATDEHPDWTW